METGAFLLKEIESKYFAFSIFETSFDLLKRIVHM